MKATALTQAERARLNEIYAEMGYKSYAYEAKKIAKKAKRPKQKFFTQDELKSLHSFCEIYQDLNFA